MDEINARLAAGGCPPTNLAEISSIVDFHARSKLEIDLAKTQKFLHDKELEWKQTEHDYLLEIKELNSKNEQKSAWFNDLVEVIGDDSLIAPEVLELVKKLKTEVKELNSQNEKNWGDLSEKIMGERDAMRFAEMEDYLMNLKTEVKAYETLTGVKRDDICAHADPNDDSLYTYKTYEEYETDAGQFDVLEVKVDDLEAEVLAAESENSEQHDQIEDLEYRLQNAICCIEIDGETLSEEDVKKLKLDHRLLVEIIEACGFDDDTSAQDLVAWVSDMADEHDPHKVGALESEIEELKEEIEELKGVKASNKQKTKMIKKLREWVDRNQSEINRLRDVIDAESDEEEKTDLFGLKD